MTSPALKSAVLSKLTTSLRIVRGDQTLRATNLSWTWPGQYDAVSIKVQRDLGDSSWEELDDVEVAVSPQPANTSCYADSVVSELVQRLK